MTNVTPRASDATTTLETSGAPDESASVSLNDGPGVDPAAAPATVSASSRAAKDEARHTLTSKLSTRK